MGRYKQEQTRKKLDICVYLVCISLVTFRCSIAGHKRHYTLVKYISLAVSQSAEGETQPETTLGVICQIVKHSYYLISSGTVYNPGMSRR